MVEKLDEERSNGNCWLHRRGRKICEECHSVMHCAKKNVIHNDMSYVEEYRKENGIEIRCLSDKILLYMRYAMDDLKLPEPLKEKCTDFFYDKVWTNPIYTNKNPRVVAAAIIWVNIKRNCMMVSSCEFTVGNRQIRMGHIAASLSISKVVVGNMTKEFERDDS